MIFPLLLRGSIVLLFYSQQNHERFHPLCDFCLVVVVVVDFSIYIFSELTHIHEE